MKGHVYFGKMSNGAIKIGFTTNIEQRLSNLFYAVPGGVDLLASANATPHGEKWLHQKFKHLRISGEWFKPDDELLQFIEQVRSIGNRAMPKECRADGVEEVKRFKPDEEVAEICRDFIRQIAAPAELGRFIGDQLAAAAERSGMSLRRITAIWYDEARAIRADEFLHLQECAEARTAALTFLGNDNAEAA